jgi:hypothetical protein
MKKLAAALILLTLLVAMVWWNSRSNTIITNKVRRFFYPTDLFLSSDNTSPEAVYSGLRQAMVQADSELVLRYISPLSREIYAGVLADPNKRAMILTWPETMTKLFQVACPSDKDCLEQAVYRLDYQEAETQVEWHGSIITLSAGPKSREVIFIKNLKGEWKIKRL